MSKNYLKQVAFEDDVNTVYLIITVPDGRLLCYNRGKKRLVPRFPSDWQCTVSKGLVRGNTNEKAIKDLVFTSFGWSWIDWNNIEFILQFGRNKKKIFVYNMTLNSTVYVMPSVGADVKALPWVELIDKVKNAHMSFSADTHAVIDMLDVHNIGGS